jgi:hypothetical protein
MTKLAEPVHLSTQPDQPICSTEAAAKVIQRHTENCIDLAADNLLRHIAVAKRPDEVAEATSAFREWAEEEGLLAETSEDAGQNG